MKAWGGGLGCSTKGASANRARTGREASVSPTARTRWYGSWMQQSAEGRRTYATGTPNIWQPGMIGRGWWMIGRRGDAALDSGFVEEDVVVGCRTAQPDAAQAVSDRRAVKMGRRKACQGLE